MAKTLRRKRSKIKRHRQSHRKTHKRQTRKKSHVRRTTHRKSHRRNKTHRRTSKKLKGGSDLNVNLLTGKPNKPGKGAFGGLTSTFGRPTGPNKYKETEETGDEIQYQSAPDGPLDKIPDLAQFDVPNYVAPVEEVAAPVEAPAKPGEAERYVFDFLNTPSLFRKW